MTLNRNHFNEETGRKARIKSEMLAALEACRLLHKTGELSDELQPVLRYMYTNSDFLQIILENGEVFT